ncbi:putative leader peptide [Actinomycetospora lemnae]|uniref:putative leader peptide n=1 Tax=Actinomycetospora lemnae TaxID=3019891 RepID=UPI0038CC09B5
MVPPRRDGRRHPRRGPVRRVARASRGKAPPARGRLEIVRATGLLLVSRLHVDLVRLASALCRR